MKRDDYVEELKKMYKEYYTESGKCRHFSECKKDAKKAECFTCDKALVGKNYGEKYDEKIEIPKIVFVGLEGLNGHKEIKPTDDTCDNAPYNPHYKGVRYVLAYLLSPFIGKERPDSVLKRNLKNYTNTTKYFALLNCYKCAFGNKPRGRFHTSSMEENCQEILFREIEILEPDIVVFQVKSEKPKGFTENLNKKFNCGAKENLICGNENTGAFRCSFPSGKRFIWIWTYHGSGRTYSNKQGWANGDESGRDYREKELDPVLNKAVEAFVSGDKID